MATRDYTAKDIERFWSKVFIPADTDMCWNWQGSLFKSGYGRYSYRGRRLIASRVVWEIVHGHIPEGLDILHSCDNPRCINPLHLAPGTHQQNMQDRNNRDRQAHVKGERHGMHKLTDEQVKIIRETYNNGGISQRELARQMSIGQSQVWRILKGESR